MKRIYDFSRNPAKRNYTVSDLKGLKQSPKKLTMSNPANQEEIKACIEGCNSAWDGKINSNFCPAGNFIYNIVLTDLNGKVRKFSGGITLIR